MRMIKVSGYIKYRYKFREGPSEDWIYIEVDESSDEAIEELLDEIAYSEHYSDCEGYRGVEWESVDEIPEDLIISWLTVAERRRDHYSSKMAFYKDLLEYP